MLKRRAGAVGSSARATAGSPSDGERISSSGGADGSLEAPPLGRGAPLCCWVLALLAASLLAVEVVVVSHAASPAALVRLARGAFYVATSSMESGYAPGGGDDDAGGGGAERSRCRIVPWLGRSGGNGTAAGRGALAGGGARRAAWRTAEAAAPGEVTDDYFGTDAMPGDGSGKNPLLRCLPNVMFVGASKCGTSSMRSHLVRHPGVRFMRRMASGAEGAEVHRFDRWDFPLSLGPVERALEWGHAPPVRNRSVRPQARRRGACVLGRRLGALAWSSPTCALLSGV